jgi:hypothetical protein
MTFRQRTDQSLLRLGASGSSGGSVFRGGVRRWIGLGVAAGAGALVLLSLPVVAQAASPSKTTFKFSGAVSGTVIQANSDCNEVGGYGGMFEFDTVKPTLKGSSSNSWTVNVNALNGKKKGGTYKKFGGLLGNGVSIVLDSSNGKQTYYWASKSGTLTTSTTGGSLDVKLIPDTGALSGKPGKGDITISGSWGCDADDS